MVWSTDGHPMFAPGPRYDFKGFLYVIFPMLFIIGDPPGKYDHYKKLGPAAAPAPVKAMLVPTLGGFALTGEF